jgi:DNA-binding PadR family transcriptional regulator
VVSSQPLSPTAYAVLGLLSFEPELTGYELRRRADSTLRFFYAAPAMSQIYSELERLLATGLVSAREVPAGQRTVRTYRISRTGSAALRRWLEETDPEPPVLKHHLALRLFLGHLVPPERLREQVAAHREWCARMQADLAAVRAGLEDDPDGTWRYARIVADWGLAYYQAELDGMARLTSELEHM